MGVGIPRVDLDRAAQVRDRRIDPIDRTEQHRQVEVGFEHRGYEGGEADKVSIGGSTSMTSREVVDLRMTFCVSTTGVSPVTVTVSCSDPTRRSAFTVAVNAVVNSTPSRRSELKPCSVKITLYIPDAIR